jgi:hypothetical protein
MNDKFFLGKKTNNNSNELSLHKHKPIKQQYTKPFTAKTLFKHAQGVPPSCNWSNRFTSIYFQKS